MSTESAVNSNRPFLGGTGRTAFLAFSETWLSPA
jgi:hypothetical protein